MKPTRALPRAAPLRALAVSPYLLLTGSSLFWAGNFIVGRALRGDIPPLALSFWRWALALAILLPLSVPALRAHRAAVRRAWRLVAALGLTGVATFQSCVYLALTTTPAINALLFLATTPIFIALLTWLVWRERLGARQAVGIAVSLLGAVVVISRGEVATLLALRLRPGDAWMLVAVVMWAIYSVLLRQRPPDLPQLPLLTSSVVAGLAMLLPVYLWRLGLGETFALTATTGLGLLYVALFPSVLAFLCWNRGVAAVGAQQAGMFLHLMPLFGALLAVLFLGERVALFHLAGAALVFGGIALTTWSARRPPG